MKRTLIRFLSLLLLLSFALALAASGGAGTTGTATPGTSGKEQSEQSSAVDLMEGFVPRQASAEDGVSSETAARVTDFAIRLFQAANEEHKNTLLSPLSVLAALAMTANGAKDETLSQMEETFGLSRDELNAFFRSFLGSLYQGKNCKMTVANSIWFKKDENFTVNRNFLQTNADYFGAGAFEAPFDGTTLRDINNWVKNNTNGMIDNIIDEIPKDALTYLINAIAFEADWQIKYTEDQIRHGVTFTREDGKTASPDFLVGEENVYYESDNATGFMKTYAQNRYAFVALLPKRGIALSDFVASLDGQAIADLLAHPSYEKVKTMMPAFETEYETELSGILSGMGMQKPFNRALADFSDLGAVPPDGNLYISRVIHKTFLSLGASGTRAAAVTAVEMNWATAVEPTAEPKTVFLNRPFVYLLIDVQTKIPFFIGTLCDPS